MQVLSRLAKFVPVAAMLYASLSHAGQLADKAVVHLRAEGFSSSIYAMQGKTEVTWTHGVDGLFSFAPQTGDQRYAINISYLNGDGWAFNFAAPMYDKATNTAGPQPLAIGRYDNAVGSWSRSPTRPGLDVRTAGYWPSNGTGWFDVLDIWFNPATGDLERFAVDFRQFDGSSYDAGASLSGNLRFNSDIAIAAVPEPETYAMLLGGLGIVALGVRRRKHVSATMS